MRLHERARLAASKELATINPFFQDTEQGQKERNYQHTWDLVSWAVIAVEMVSKERVENPAGALKVLKERVLQNIDPGLVELLQPALSEDPEKRPQEIDKFLAQIVDLTERRKQRLNWKS